MLIRHAITIAVAVVATALGASPSSAGAPKNFFGVVEGRALKPNDAAAMADSGVTSYRFSLPWSQEQPSKHTYDWAHSDEIVGRLSAQGIRPLPFVYGTPSWLSPSPQSPPLKGRKKRAWKRFLKAAVGRYGPGGSYWSGGPTSPYHVQFGPAGKPKPIKAWQIWNEPNFKNYWLPTPSPREYARLVKISHRAIASVDRRAKIVLAGMPGYVNDTAWSFLDEIYQAPGIKRAFDATALHPYARNITQLRIEIRKFRAVQRKHRDARTPVWLTEQGWGSGPDRLSELNKGRQGQKRLLKRSFGFILHKRQRWNIGRVFWFTWRDGGTYATGSCDFCKSAGLLKADGSPKPSWYVYRRVAR